MFLNIKVSPTSERMGKDEGKYGKAGHECRVMFPPETPADLQLLLLFTSFNHFLMSSVKILEWTTKTIAYHSPESGPGMGRKEPG